MKKLYVQYGAGKEAEKDWLNYDSSPTLRIQKTPILGLLLRRWLNYISDDEIKYGDIVKGLPIQHNTVDGLFCGHVLEHLTRTDFDTALNNSFNYLKPGGKFRLVVPDLQIYIQEYIKSSSSDNYLIKNAAAEDFCKNTLFGKTETRANLLNRIKAAFGNSTHQWMWDYDSLSEALRTHGFINIRPFLKGNADDEIFLRPEREYQFAKGLAIECEKPK